MQGKRRRGQGAREKSGIVIWGYLITHARDKKVQTRITRLLDGFADTSPEHSFLDIPVDNDYYFCKGGRTAISVPPV